MILGSRLSVAEWDALQTKEQLYARFDGKESPYKDPEMGLFFTDDKAKAVAEYLKKTAETLRPAMLDIAAHFTDLPEPRKNEAENILNDMYLDDTENVATLAFVIYHALDSANESSFICRILNGNGVREARAEARAFARYLKFKAEDDARMKAFKNTAEYRVQEAEMRLGLRNHFELPEE